MGAVEAASGRTAHLGRMRMRTRVGEIPGVEAIAIKAIALTQNETEEKKIQKIEIPYLLLNLCSAFA